MLITSTQFFSLPGRLGSHRAVRKMTVLPDLRFWPMDISMAKAVQPFQERLFGHRQVTDGYLLGLDDQEQRTHRDAGRGIEALAGGESYRQHETVLEG